MSDIKVSELKVMRSAAGWYVGRDCVEDGWLMPYSRESGYFATETDAQIFLDWCMQMYDITDDEDEFYGHEVEDA